MSVLCLRSVLAFRGAFAFRVLVSKPEAVCLTTRSFLQRSVASFFFFDALRIFGTGDAGVVGINWCDSFHKQIPLLYMRFIMVCILLRHVYVYCIIESLQWHDGLPFSRTRF